MTNEVVLNANQPYSAHLRGLLDADKTASPRGFPTREMIGKQYCVRMESPVVTLAARAPNYKFMLGEAWWILSGSNRLADIEPFMRGYHKFSDDGFSLTGAYGPMVVEQLSWVAAKLREDPDSRQAVMSIWRPRPGPSKDVPCTVALQFFIREHQLHCVATMRSSDAWLGLVYDQFVFSMIALIIMKMTRPLVSLRLGRLILNIGSAHLYERDVKLAGSTYEEHGTVNETTALLHPLGQAYTTADELLLALHQLALSAPTSKDWEREPERVKRFVTRELVL